MKALIQIVDVADRAALLRSSRTPSIKASSLVRIRNRSRNRNDLAFVSCVDGNSVETSFVNPTSAELDALSQSPLYNPTGLIDTADIASSASAEVSQRFTRAILAARKDLKVMSIGDKVVVVSGPFSGIHGTIVDVLDHNIVLQIRLQGQLPSLEVPLSHLASFPPPTPGRLVQVTSGPYKGLNGLIESLGDEHAIFQPSDQCTQLLDVACRSVARDYTVGDHIKVVEGLHKGTSGFVVKNDLWQLEIFVKESMSMVSVCTDDVLESPPEEANNTEATTPTTTRLMKGPERFKDLEVTVIGKNQWKGRIGAIVGHSYPSNTDTMQQLDDKDLIFKVRIGNDLSINAPTFKPSELQELRTKLPVLVAAKLPPSITHPPRIVPPSHQRAHTPEGDVDDDIDDYLWRPDAEELARPREPHWLLKVPMNFKVQVAIRGTTEGDINRVHRDAYRAGRYEGMTGSVVVTNALQDERSSVNVRIQDETNRRFKIMYLDPLQEPSAFQVGSRVLIIGRDLSGANAFEGQYGHISACVYPLPVGQHLVFIQPNFYAYFDIKSLCFSGDMVEWQGNIH
ncbi:hypothetical protein ONZ45_g18810 [Pleurotus djamor]|nr:hypothetical protein ONZ45_g18810 [Pleurotus djamor]